MFVSWESVSITKVTFLSGYIFVVWNTEALACGDIVTSKRTNPAAYGKLIKRAGECDASRRNLAECWLLAGCVDVEELAKVLVIFCSLSPSFLHSIV